MLFALVTAIAPKGDDRIVSTQALRLGELSFRFCRQILASTLRQTFPDCILQCLNSAIAMGGEGLHGFQRNRQKSSGDIGTRDGIICRRRKRGHWQVSIMGRVTGQDFKQDRAKQIDVASGIELGKLAQRHLGRHVLRGTARKGVREITVGISGDGDAPVPNPDLAEVSEKDIRRLEIAVNHTLGVGIGNDIGDPVKNREIILHGSLANHAAPGNAGCPFHGIKIAAVLCAAEFLNEKADRRRRRRILPDNDFCRLLTAIEKAAVNFGMTGEERMLLYWLAAETGLRWSEIKSLRGTSFTFPEDMGNPTVRILAKDAKNGEDDELPLLPELAARMRSYLENKPPEALVFSMPAERRGARMLRADLESIGIAYVEQGRYFDFHSLRGMCATRLAKAGVPLTLVQRVMRHSDPKLTANLYNHYDMDTKIEALSKLPTLKPADAQKPTIDSVPTENIHGDTGKEDGPALTFALFTPSLVTSLRDAQGM